MAKAKKAAKKSTTKSAKKSTKVAKKPSRKKTSLLNQIAAYRKEIEKIKDKSYKAGSKLFKKAIKEIFSKFPEIKSFSWDEYTPHWNDGDECVFGCHFETTVLEFNDGSKNSDDLWSLQHLSELLSGDLEEKKKEITNKISKVKDEWEKNSLKSNLETLNKYSTAAAEQIQNIHRYYIIKKTIVDLLDGIDNSMYQNMFGDGTVTVTRDDVSVSECEHD